MPAYAHSPERALPDRGNGPKMMLNRQAPAIEAGGIFAALLGELAA
jgi:hypothetical protein